MSQSLSSVFLHVIFSTKKRAPIISPNFEKKLYAYIAGICRNLGSKAYRIGGTENHIHIACTLPRTVSISQFIATIKGRSSSWLRDKTPWSYKFEWQAGYAVFSVGQSNLRALTSYIAKQREHHKSQSFKNELLLFCRRYGVKYNKDYIWD